MERYNFLAPSKHLLNQYSLSKKNLCVNPPVLTLVKNKEPFNNIHITYLRKKTAFISKNKSLRPKLNVTS